MFETFNLYCERTGPEFWAEPANALTNLLFFVSAWFIWRRANRLGAGSPGVWLLLALVCAIGIGSFLFHTFATGWAQLMDDLPILLFQLVYLWLYCREVAGIRPVYIFGIVLGYLVAALMARQFPQVLNGSLIYAPAMIVLLALGIYHLATRRIEPYIMLGTAGMFVISLAFRTMDNAICHAFPLGSHFMWHVCNGLLLYLLMRGLLANRLPQPIQR